MASILLSCFQPVASEKSKTAEADVTVGKASRRGPPSGSGPLPETSEFSSTSASGAASSSGDQPVGDGAAHVAVAPQSRGQSPSLPPAAAPCGNTGDSAKFTLSSVAVSGPSRQLLRAARNGDHHAVSRLLSHCASEPNMLHSTDNMGWTPLHYAASKGHAEVVTALLQAGASASLVDSHGWTPLQLASLKGHQHIAAKLQA